MDAASDTDKGDEVMMPGFRFHPTDEELVGFYLRRKVEQKPLAIELIRQLDIYKHDPWDLPQLAMAGEKEWYFYCPRDRKYRNSTRPNRVTEVGFWKATGTDRPIYSSQATKCIGLKKSLVFYKGRASKGVKTDWMMHEFRLPSPNDKRPLDKDTPANDSWAICRIFKKVSTATQRLQPQTTNSSFNGSNSAVKTQFGSRNLSCMMKRNRYEIQFGCNSEQLQQQPSPSLPVITNAGVQSSTVLSCQPSVVASEFPGDVASIRLKFPPEMLADDKAPATRSVDFREPEQCNVWTVGSQLEIEGSLGRNMNACNLSCDQWENARNLLPDFSFDWKHNFTWESPPCQPPMEMMSTSYSRNTYYN